MDFDIDLHDARLETILNICDRLVVDNGPQFFEKIVQQTLSGEITDSFFHTFLEVLDFPQFTVGRVSRLVKASHEVLP